MATAAKSHRFLEGFGTFKQVARAARTGLNPSSGEKIKIAAHKFSNSCLARHSRQPSTPRRPSATPQRPLRSPRRLLPRRGSPRADPSWGAFEFGSGLALWAGRL